MARRPSVEALLLVASTAALAAGGAAWLAGAHDVADGCWIAATVLAIVPAAWWVVDALRRHLAGVDLMALLALVGTLLVGQYLAGALIAVMLGTGRTLDAAAERRATRDLHALLQRAPRVARRREGAEVREVPLEAVAPGDVVLVGPGEVVPVDGTVAGVAAVLDESALSGESELVERAHGDEVRSGVVNAGGAFELHATATAADSTYAGIVELVRHVGAQSAPVVRLADRYAGWFLWVSLAGAGVAWGATGSLLRAVAVLVVATPCPLLLAAPVAIVSGLARASSYGVIVRGGAALESLAAARTMVVDKTGTLTAGRPAVLEVAVRPGDAVDDVLALAASAELLSSHVLAAAIVTEARRRGLVLQEPVDVVEEAGRGVTATVGARRVRVGRRAGADGTWAAAVINRARLDGAAIAWVTVDDAAVGAVLLRDPVRGDAARTVRRLRAAGIRRLVMLTGDRPEPAQEIGTVLGLDEVYPDQTPQTKVAAVRREQSMATTLMVGDGINDAPALAVADIGVAMGGRGATASSEAADIVLTTDRLDRLADAMDIARRARRIAVQSALAGIGLSLAAMGAAGLGWLPPTWGALLQEAIDVAVIVNALRALRGSHAIAVAARTEALLQRFSDEHDELRSLLPLLRDAADDVAAAGLDVRALHSVLSAYDALVERILPHERAEEAELYPALSEPLGGEATGPMSRTHAEIERLTRRLGVHVDALRRGDTPEVPVEDLLACLYGLHAVLTLHFVQEEENYFTLISSDAR